MGNDARRGQQDPGELDGALPERGDDRLNAEQRERAIARLAGATPDNPLDVLIVGGGVVGAGAALDAASRGLNVGLVEQRDLASGTSSRSSRLAHGGLRYLEHREFALVHEALTERGLLLDRIAPHLVRPLPFLLPLSGPIWQKSYFGAGVTLYDLLSRVGAYGGTLPRPRTLSRAAARGIAPGLDPERIKGGVRFHDAQIDDARHVLALARTAVSFGAAVVPRCQATEAIIAPGDSDVDRVVGFDVTVDPSTGWNEIGPGDEPGRSASAAISSITGGRPTGGHIGSGTGPSLRQAQGGATGSGTLQLAVHARCVLAATGVWTDEFRSRAQLPPGSASVRQAKGVHLVVPRHRIRCSTAVIARTPTSVLFLLPWGDRWLIGTTDTDYDGDLADPRADAEDVDYLLDQANRWLAEPLTRDDLVGVYCGLRPLIASQVAESAADQTAELSREHVVLRPIPGLVVVAGGKYTTYRVMARDAVDAVVADRTAQIGGELAGCRTHEIAVVGADEYAELWPLRGKLAREWGISEEAVCHLLRRHGDRAPRVVALVADDPELGRPLHPDAPHLRAEVVVAVTDEGARTVEDVLVRRTRVALETADVGRAALADTVAIMSGLLGWDGDEAAGQAERYASDWPVTWQRELA